MEKKHKKILVYIFTILLITLTFSPVSSENIISNSDQVDQEQAQTSGKDYIFSDHWKAQSFKPTSKILTRIQLYINKIGDIQSNLEIIIKDSLTGENLTNCSVSSSEIPYTNPEWVEFNFPDINLTIDQTYYILCKTSTGDQSNSYNWYEASGNPYERGTKYFSDDNGITWQQNPDYDFCFRTYTQKAELYIQYIKGGFGWNIYYGIKNIGNTEADNITVEITLSGGLIITGRTHTEEFDQTLQPGEILDNTLSTVIGLGPTEVTITVTSPETPATSKTAQGFLFLFSIYISPV